MKILSTCFQVSAIGVFAACVAPLHAELPPGAYESLKQEAKEVLHIEVVNVSRVRGGKTQAYYRCRARVTKVDRSAKGYRMGSMIIFDTWSVEPAAGENFAGPAIPPKISAGWSGRVFLNPADPDPTGAAVAEAEVLQLAAYGRSFEPDRKTRRREATKGQARKLFEQMEQRLNQPRTIKFIISGESRDGRSLTTITTELWLRQGNKVNLEAKVSPKDWLFGDNWMLISDGNKILVKSGTVAQVIDSPKHLRNQLLFDFVRMGWMWMLRAGGDDTQLSHNHIRTSDFRLGARTRNNGRTVQAIHYRAYLAEDKTTVDIVLYIDAETFLPVRRTISSARFGRVQEQYEIQLDPKAKEGLFDLPA